MCIKDGPLAHRLPVEPAVGQQAIDTLRALQVVDPGLQSRWEGAARQALEAVARVFERSAGARLPRLHGCRLYTSASPRD